MKLNNIHITKGRVMTMTYFEELLQELSKIKQPDTLTTIIMEDVYRRAMNWLSNFEILSEGYNSDYILRQLTYLRSYLSK